MKFASRLKFTIIPSLLVLLVALVMTIAGFGLNMGLDFTGGTLVTLSMGQDFDVNDVRSAFNAQGVSELQIAKTGEAEKLYDASVRMPDLNDPDHELEIRLAVVENLKTKYPNVVNSQTEHVGAVAGSELVRNAIMSVAIAGVLMMVYIWFRFELISGAVAIVNMIHDVLVMISFMVILRSFIQMNSSFIAAVLTIVGYSINNVIIIFDRIRENRKRYNPREMSSGDLVDKSIKETLTRTINTSLTTLTTITLLYILGVDAIREFALPIIVGLLAGVYSSIFLAGPAWAFLIDKQAKHRPEKASGKKRKQARARA